MRFFTPIFIFWLILAGCSRSPDAPSPNVPSDAPSATPSAPSPRAEFEALCRQIQASDNEYYGTAQVAALEAQLEAGGLAAAELVEVRRRLAVELLRVGRPGAAVEQLSQALQVAQQYLETPTQVQLLADLGLATLRFGEVRNCVELHTPEMCLFPIAPGGVHREPRPAQDAVRAFRGVLAAARDPAEQPLARWLLNLAAMTAGQYPEAVPSEPRELRLDPERLESEQAFPVFEERAHSVGLHIFDPSGGAVVDDFTGDGRLEVVTSSIDPCRPLRFFVRGEAGKFEDRAAVAGLDAQLGGLNLVHADYDNDGDPDLLVLRGGWMAADGRMRNSLLHNQFKVGGTFREDTFLDVTHAVGLAEPAYPTQTAAWADADLDGDLDLYIGNEGPYGGAHPGQLFRNELIGTSQAGEVRFTDVAQSAGVAAGEHWTKGVAWGDYDNDGDPDLYLSRIGPNRLYRNDTQPGGELAFTDVTNRHSVAEPAGRSFATWFFDFDNDGDLDLFVADYSATVVDVARHFFGEEVETGHPRLYRNDLVETGTPGFTDISRRVGFTAPALPMGANFGDLDNDGFLDLYLGTGLPSYESLTPNLMYRNARREDGGRRFVDVTFAGRFGHLQKGHGVAFADFDGDGDQDVFEQMGGAYPGDAYPSVLYENPGNDNAWIQLHLVGRRANRDALGARVRVEIAGPPGSEGERVIHRVVNTGGSFGGNPRRLEIGLGPWREDSRISRVVIRWPFRSGTEQIVEGLEPFRSYRIPEGGEPDILPIN